MYTHYSTTDAVAPWESVHALPEASSRKWSFWLVLGVLLTSFFLIEHGNSQFSLNAAYQFTADELTELVTEGDGNRRLGITILALCGGVMILTSKGRGIAFWSALGWMMLLSLIWSGASVFWSEDPPLAMKRFIVLTFCSIGALGVARTLTLLQLCQAVLIVTTIFVGYSFFLELKLGTFQPFSADYRFSGTLHPNAQAANCAMMAMTAGFLAREVRRGRAMLWLLCGIGLGFLLLTKSRSALASMMIGVLLFKSLGATWSIRLLVAFAMLWLISTGLLFVSLFGEDAEAGLTNAMLIGRQEEAESLSGRVPLWIDLLSDVKDRPLIGHGYMTFWNPYRVARFSADYQWAVTDGHNAYLDMMLDLGLIGAALCISTVCLSLREVACRYRLTQRSDYGFLFALISFRAVHGLFESSMTTATNFVSFTLICGLLHLGFFQTQDELTSLDEAPLEAY